VFTISPNGTRIDFDRTNFGVFSLDIGTVETLTVNGLGGGDVFTVNDLSGVASLATLNLNGFADDDIFTFVPASAGPIAFNVHGGPGVDGLRGPDAGATWNITAPDQGNIAGLINSFRFIDVLVGGSGNDIFNIRAFPMGTPAVAGGGGTDTLNYNAESRAATVTPGITPAEGTIESPGVQTVTFVDIEIPNIINAATFVPSAFRVSSIVGNVVTFRWTPPAIGPAPTEYVLEGGVFPGQVLASIATGSASPIFTVAVPTGAFYARVYALDGAVRSAPSNEILFFVNMPVPPSAPAGLVGVVNDSSVQLAWRNTFGGGATEALILEVSGSLSGAVALGVGETANFVSVPAGNYTFALRAANRWGTSVVPSNSIELSVPSACSGTPLPPDNFLAYKIGNTAYVVWEPAATGNASTGYVLHVRGAFTLDLPTNQRTLSGAVPPGVYNLSVSATNICGSSAPTPVQTVVIP
jgi:hypothetical protein